MSNGEAFAAKNGHPATPPFSNIRDDNASPSTLQLATTKPTSPTQDHQADGTDESESAPPPPVVLDPEASARLESAKKELAINLAKKKKLDRELAALELSLYAHETIYLTDPSANSFGNIVKGYEAYVKAPPSTTIPGDLPHSTRRKRAFAGCNNLSGTQIVSQAAETVGDAERVFSKSSGSYARALEVRSKEHESTVTSEQESVVPLLQTADQPRKKSKS